MLTTTTKSLIFISFILASAVALQDGDQVAFKTHGNFFNAKYQYLNAGTVDGSVGMAANTDFASASGTWWKAHKLSDGSWAFESLGSIHNAQHIYLNANTYTGSLDLVGSTDYATVSGTHWSLQTLSDGNVALKSLGNFNNPKFVYLNTNTYTGSVNLAGGTDYATLSGTHWEIVTLIAAGSQPASLAGNGISSAESKLIDFIKSNADQIKSQPSVDINYCLQQLTSTSFESAFGPVADAIIQAGCTHGPKNCDLRQLDGIFNQLKGSGTDPTTIEKLYILIGNMIGSVAGAAACDGAKICEWVGGKVGSTLTCLAISKQVFDGMMTAVSTLHNVANQVGDIGQDAVNAINNAANTAQNGVQSAIDQINQGGSGALSALKGVTNQVGQSFTAFGNSVVGGLTTVGGAIASGATTAGGAIASGATTAGGAIASGATTAGGAIASGASTAGSAIAHGFCGIFGC